MWGYVRDVECARVLIEHGVSPENALRPRPGFSSATVERRILNPSVVRYLLACGARVMFHNPDRSALLGVRDPEIVSILLDAGADISVGFDTILSDAVESDNPQLIRLLVSAARAYDLAHARQGPICTQRLLDEMLSRAYGVSHLRGVKALLRLGADADALRCDVETMWEDLPRFHGDV